MAKLSFITMNPEQRYSSLDKGKLGGGNVESVDIRGKAGIGLLGSVRATRTDVSVLPGKPRKRGRLLTG